jgi:hypothetical protein
MMRIPFLFAVLALGVLLSSCSHKDQAASSDGAPHVTVTMRDGSRVGGTLTDNSATKITVAGDDGISRTIPVSQVGSVNYDSAPSAPAAVTSEPAPMPAASQPPAPSRVQYSTPASPAAPRKPADRPAAAMPPPPPPPPQDARMQPDGVIETHTHPVEAAITTKTYALPVGTDVSVRAEETIDSAKAVEGQTFAGEVTQDVLDADGNVVIPRGANAQLIIRSASKGGKIRGASDLVLDLAEVSIDGRQYELSTSDLVQQGKAGVGANKRTAIYTGGGAALGAIIGAIAGGGKGAAIGAGAGGGGGALAQILTKGGAIRIPVETVLKFQLDKPLHVTASR